MKARSTQSLVNTYPFWANVRTDEQSLGYQVFNVIGKHFDDIIQQNKKGYDNLFISSAAISDMDIYYSIQLPGNYTFTKEEDDETELLYTPPTVSGLYNGVFYKVNISDNNDIKSFWYDAIPSRYTISTDTASGEFLFIDKEVVFSPLTPIPVSGILPVANNIYVTISGGNSFIGIENNQITRYTTVQIEGTTKAGQSLMEEMIFVHNETQKTFHEFESISNSGIRVYGVEPSGARIIVKSHRFNDVDYSDNYNIGTTSLNEDMPTFWGLGTSDDTPSGYATLDLFKYEADDLELRMNGYTNKEVILKQKLLDENGSSITPIDMAIEPYSNRIWVLSSTNNDYPFIVTVYSTDLPSNDYTLLQGKNYNAYCAIEPNTYFCIPLEEIELAYIWKKPTVGVVRHRAWVIKPDGTKKSLESGAEITYHTDSTSWIYSEPKSRKLRNNEYYTLTDVGDYTYCLEVYYTDETTMIDKRVISVLAQSPLMQWNLGNLVGRATGIDFDNENNLWVINNTHTWYKLIPHWDNMMIDFERKVIYFREPYEKVKIANT